MLVIFGLGLSFGLAWALSIQVYAVCAVAMAIWVLCSFVAVGDRIVDAQRRLGTEPIAVIRRPLGVFDWIGTSFVSIVFGAFWPLLILIRLRQWQIDRVLSDDGDEP